MIDFKELTPAPWKSERCEIEGPIVNRRCLMKIYDEGRHNEADAAFIALARNALDAEMRRSKEGWRIYWDLKDKRFVFHGVPGDNPIPCDIQDKFNWQDPYTAWVSKGERK